MARYDKLSESEFTSLQQGGQKNVFGQIFKQYFKALCYFAGKIVTDKQGAEDIVGGVFEKLWKGEANITSPAHLKSYLYLATKRACIDHLRKSQHAKQRQMSFLAQGNEWEEEHIHQMIRAEVLREIYLEIKNLPEQCSKIVSLSYIEGLKNEEIAEKLGLSLQTVKNQKSRGITLLRGKLSPELFMVFVIVCGMK